DQLGRRDAQSCRPVIGVAAVEPHGGTVPANDQPIAAVLDFANRRRRAVLTLGAAGLAVTQAEMKAAAANGYSCSKAAKHTIRPKTGRRYFGRPQLGPSPLRNSTVARQPTPMAS